MDTVVKQRSNSVFEVFLNRIDNECPETKNLYFNDPVFRSIYLTLRQTGDNPDVLADVIISLCNKLKAKE